MDLKAVELHEELPWTSDYQTKRIDLIPPHPDGYPCLNEDERYEIYESAVEWGLTIKLPGYAEDPQAQELQNTRLVQAIMRRKFETCQYEAAIKVNSVPEYEVFLSIDDIIRTRIMVKNSPVFRLQIRDRPRCDRTDMKYYLKFRCVAAAQQHPRAPAFVSTMRERAKELCNVYFVRLQTFSVPNGPDFWDFDRVKIVLKQSTRRRIVGILRQLRMEDAVRIQTFPDIDEFSNIQGLFEQEILDSLTRELSSTTLNTYNSYRWRVCERLRDAGLFENPRVACALINQTTNWELHLRDIFRQLQPIWTSLSASGLFITSWHHFDKTIGVNLFNRFHLVNLPYQTYVLPRPVASGPEDGLSAEEWEYVVLAFKKTFTISDEEVEKMLNDNIEAAGANVEGNPTGAGNEAIVAARVDVQANPTGAGNGAVVAARVDVQANPTGAKKKKKPKKSSAGAVETPEGDEEEELDELEQDVISTLNYLCSARLEASSSNQGELVGVSNVPQEAGTSGESTLSKSQRKKERQRRKRSVLLAAAGGTPEGEDDSEISETIEMMGNLELKPQTVQGLDENLMTEEGGDVTQDQRPPISRPVGSANSFQTGSFPQNQPQNQQQRRQIRSHYSASTDELKARSSPSPTASTSNGNLANSSRSQYTTNIVENDGKGATGPSSAAGPSDIPEKQDNDPSFPTQQLSELEIINFPEPTSEQNSKFHNLTLRGMDFLEGVGRDLLNEFVTNEKLSYDSILPSMDQSVTQEGYEAESNIMLETNMFPVTFNTKEFFSYPVDWQPRSTDIYRPCKLNLWHNVCPLVKVLWENSMDGNKQPEKFDPGAWDLGDTMFRHDRISRRLLQDPRKTSLKFKSVVQSLVPMGNTKLFRLYDTEKTQVAFKIQKTKVKTVPTDITDIVTTGCTQQGISRWKNLRNVLQSIFLIHPAWTLHWIEDSRQKRLFFPRVKSPQLQAAAGSGGQMNANIMNLIYGPQYEENDNHLFEFRRGYRGSPRLFPSGVYVNVWTCLAPFYKPGITVDKAIESVLKAKYNTQYTGWKLEAAELQWITDSLKFIRVETKLTQKIDIYENVAMYPRRYYRIHGFSAGPCDSLNVRIYDRAGMSRGPNIPFLEFCEDRYKDAYQKWPQLKLENMRNSSTLRNLPAVKVNNEKDYYLPPWALEIRRDDKHRIKGGGILSDIARRKRRDLYKDIGAQEYMESITTWMKFWVETDESLPSFKISIDPTPLRIPGARLHPPRQELFFAQSNSPDLTRPYVTEYSWQCQRDEKSNTATRLVQYARVSRPMVLYFDNISKSKVSDWIKDFRNKNKLQPNQFDVLEGIYVKYCECGSWANSTVESFLSVLDTHLYEFTRISSSRNYPDLIILFMSTRNTMLYNAFKTKCDVQLGVISQVVILKNFDDLHSRRYGEQELQAALLNILLKLNKKLGGMNLELRTKHLYDKCGSGAAMIFGADVTHPSGDIHHSIASIVATIDYRVSSYAARVRIQPHRQEIIGETQTMVADLVSTFVAKNPGKIVDKVFFFRDGVGNDEMCKVLSEEIPAIFRGLMDGGADPSVKLVHLVAIKRHHTRFTNPVTNDGIQPGMVVNALPISPLQTSFYMCSHLHPLKSTNPAERAKRGVCRTTLYHVLVNQLGISLPELQTMMYHLCYTYERGTRSLSMVPAIHYAHLACTRGRIHYQGRDPSETADLSVHQQLKDKMYYL
ncbi:hypothetical protein R1sor_006846 [Riccia sorocarpa]|uniref:Piwi domain-containing protein n=1 Tax=Riccia sorocarpa TaxID=122646 RepID=A0ABD3HNR9_9MARC